MRESLKKIEKSTHTVIRIDEYDRSIGSSASSGSEMHEAHKQVESEFMNWLQNLQEDNVFAKNNIFIVMTTNHKENITGPLLRSGRADLVIDIADFDEASIKESFLSAPTRMKNRGAIVVGFETINKFQDAICKLDLVEISSLATRKGFTVRDVDSLLQEMASHNYYYSKGKEGIPWSTSSFVKVLEGSQGSVKGENTNELILGDRFVIDHEDESDPQSSFDFYQSSIRKFDEIDLVDASFFD